MKWIKKQKNLNQITSTCYSKTDLIKIMSKPDWERNSYSSINESQKCGHLLGTHVNKTNFKKKLLSVFSPTILNGMMLLDNSANLLL